MQVEKELFGLGRSVDCQVGCDVWYLCWMSSNMGLCSLKCCSGMSSLLWWSNGTHICSYGTRRDRLLTCLRSVMVSLMLPYSSLHLSMQRVIIINELCNVIVHQVGHLHRAVPGCTVSET